MALSKRLQQLQIEEEISEERYMHLTMEELSNMKIQFGKTYKGRTFEDIWVNHQHYILWFTQHYANSVKAEHRVFLWFIRMKVERAELQGSRIVLKGPENSEPTSQKTKAKGGYQVPSSKAKAKAHPAPPSEIEEELLSDWSDGNLIDEFPVAPTVMESRFETRLVQLENALSRVVHLETQTTQTSNP